MYERGQAFSWQWSFCGRAALQLYEATGEKRFLDLLIGAARNVMAARDDMHGVIDENQKRVVKSWGSKITFGGPVMRGTDITATGLIALPILQLANRLAARGEVNDEMIGLAKTYTDVIMADPNGINAMTRRSDTPRLIDFRKPLSSETPEWQSYVPMIAAGLFFVDRDRRIGEKLRDYMLRFPQWFPNGLCSGGGVAILARAYSLRRGFRL